MAEEYTLQLSRIIKDLQLTALYLPKSADDIYVKSREVNRPGVALNGFYDFFDKLRICVLGKSEMAMLESFGQEKMEEAIKKFFSMQPPAVIIARDLEAFPIMVESAKEHGVPLLTSTDSTSNVVAALVSLLNVELAPRITRHGVLVEVYGEGILILGESGVGKSEAAIELVKRGHRLVADDAVEIKKVSDISLVGSSPEIIRHFIELRGIGIIDVKEIFGIGAVKNTEKIDMIINLETWVDGKQYDRLGLEDEYTEILGIKIPSLLIPVKPGRNLAVIVEIAAMNNRQKRNGYNAAEELNKRLMAGMEG